ncbi:MAG: DUF1552 domain-containing protein [Myxococcota bacterium]
MHHLTRRGLLAGLGTGAGAALLHPFLRGALATKPLPRRFVIVVEGNAIEPLAFLSPAAEAAIGAQSTDTVAGRRWSYDRYGHADPLVVSDGDLGSARALDPLTSAGGGVDLVSKSLVALGLSSWIAGGGHSCHFGALSCSRSTPTRPAGQTIDAWLAERPTVRDTTPFDAVRLGVAYGGGILANYTCAFAADRSAPVTLDPSMAYDNLFGFLPGSPGAAAFARRSKQLDFALSDLDAVLAAFPGNSQERAKLEAYLDSLLVIRQRQDDLLAIAAAIDPADPSTAFPAPVEPASNPLYGTGDHFDMLEAQFENVTAALLGGLTHVAVVTSGTGDHFSYMDYSRVLADYPEIPAGLGRHDLHHNSGADPGATGAYVDAIHAVTREHVVLIADLARALEAVPEQGGTMLDHTAILYLSDNGEQHHGTASEWPCLLVGGGALGLATDGRTVVYPGTGEVNHRQLSNLFNTLGYASGEALDDFGLEGETRIALGPLSELQS